MFQAATVHPLVVEFAHTECGTEVFWSSKPSHWLTIISNVQCTRNIDGISEIQAQTEFLLPFVFLPPTPGAREPAER
jgi:hypothetical protein